METITNPTIAATYAGKAEKTSFFKRFIQWAEAQESNRIGWVAGILGAHGCIITPITLFAVILSGSNIILFSAALVAMMAALVTNLAAMPTKYTITTFFISIVLDLVIIASTIAIGFDITQTYQ